MMIFGWTRLEKNESKNKFLGLVIAIKEYILQLLDEVFISWNFALKDSPNGSI
jgi:hypothetical protein